MWRKHQENLTLKKFWFVDYSNIVTIFLTALNKTESVSWEPISWKTHLFWLYFIVQG